jgi:hypothetical protein
MCTPTGSTNIHEEFLCPNLGHFLENVPNWDVFERLISAEVRVSADSYDPWIGCWFGHRRRRGGEIDDNRFLNFGGPIANN